MFRFSLPKDTPLNITPRQLTSMGIAEDEDHIPNLKDDGEYRPDERYYRAENERPESIQEAIEFVHGIFEHAPVRVWLGAEPHEVTAEELEHTRKPTL